MINCIKIMLDEGAKKPTRAHRNDAGADVYSRETKIVPAHGSAIFDTGLHVEVPDGYAAILKSKSGLNVKHNITSTGVIDAGYTGSVCVKLYNHGEIPYVVNAGDKISQMLIIKVETPCFIEDDTFNTNTERGDKGFGSSGV